MAGHQAAGEAGEREVCDKVSCPNCGKKLVQLPPGFPMFDVQCARCLFRAQVKTVNGKPRGVVRGAGWDIYEKVLKAGHLAPPLRVNFKWRSGKESHQEIRFYPFIAKRNVRKYQLSPEARRANYRMFNYVGLDKAPYMVCLISDQIDPSPECRAVIAAE